VARLWIDDVRPAPATDWIVARSSQEAIDKLKQIQFDHISFDHDLGGSDTAMKVIEWIEGQFYNNGVLFHFDYDVHSANPVGRQNIKTALDRLFQAIGVMSFVQKNMSGPRI